MSASTVLQLDDANLLGNVTAVDTSRVVIAVANSSLLPRAFVGSLVAIRGSTAQEILIGMTERVTRQLREQTSIADPLAPTSLALEVVPDDTVRVALLGTFRIVDGAARNVFKRGADSFPQIDRQCFLVEGGNLQRFMNILGKDLGEEERLELGRFALDDAAKAIANGDRFFQRHAAILGSTGSGKSWCVSLMLERASARRFPNIIVLDMHGEYASLANPPTDTLGNKPEAIATAFKVAGPGDLDGSDPNRIFLPYWLLNREEMLAMILDRSDQNAPNQASRFTTHVRELKEGTLVGAAKEHVRATFTVDSPIPYELSDLVNRLESDDTAKGLGIKGGAVKGEWEGRLTRFISRLRAKREDRRYGFMFQPPAEASSYEWLSTQIVKLLGAENGRQGVKIIDFSEVPSDVLPVVAGVFARLLYDVQFWLEPEKRTPFVFVCDEAHLYLPVREDANAVEKQALNSFERVAKEGRKYGVSLLVVSQRPSDVSRTILSQCNNFLILRLTNDQDQNVVKRLMPDSLSGLLDALPLLDLGEAFLLGDAILLPSRIKLARPLIAPLSQTREFWTEWGNRQPDVAALIAAVDTLRSQSRAGGAGGS